MAARERTPADPRRWTLIVVCVSTALLLLNVSAPNVALESIGDDIHASFTDLQWVLSGYALCLAVFQLTAGSLSDLFGRRRLFIIGLVAFTIASALCAAAPSPVALVLARAIQGVAAAVMFPSSLALLAQEFEGRDRTRAISIWGAVIGLAFAAGPLAGGVLVDLFNWRAIFILNVVLATPTVALAARHIRESRDPDPSPVDVPGVVTLSIGLFLLVFAILRGNALGWTSAVIVACFAGGAVFLASFVVVELRRRAPMLDVRLFGNRTFTGASIVVGCMAAGSFASFVYISLYLLVVREGSPAAVGLELAPLALVAFCASILGPRIVGRVPLWATLSGGMALAAAGQLAMRGLDAHSAWPHFVLGLMITGAGVGLTNPLVTLAHLGVLPPEHSGLASGVNNTSRQLGVAIGIAVLGALLQARVGSALSSERALNAVGAARGRVIDHLEDSDVPGALVNVPGGARSGVLAAYNAAFATALNEVLIVAAGLAAAGALTAALLIRTRDFHAARRAAPAEAAA